MTDEEKRIRDKFKQKTWNEIKTNDSWAIFKVMSEFVEGYERLSRIGPCVTIFGSARTKPEHPNYIMAEEIAFQLTQNGFGVIELRLLREIADARPLGNLHLTHVFGVHTGHNTQERRLTRAVSADHADLRAEEKGEGDIFQHRLLIVLFGQVLQVINIFASHKIFLSKIGEGI